MRLLTKLLDPCHTVEGKALAVFMALVMVWTQVTIVPSALATEDVTPAADAAVAYVADDSDADEAFEAVEGDAAVIDEESPAAEGEGATDPAPATDPESQPAAESEPASDPDGATEPAADPAAEPAVEPASEGDPSESSDPSESPSITGDSTVTAGATIQLAAAGFSGTVTWSSSDPSIATVDANGVVTGVAAGVATISAACDDQVATLDVTVTKVAASIDGSRLVAVGGTTQLAAHDFAGDVTWASRDSSCATVDENGLVTGVSAGSVWVNATDGTETAYFKVLVASASS